MTGRLESLGARSRFVAEPASAGLTSSEVRKSGGKGEQTFAGCLIEMVEVEQAVMVCRLQRAALSIAWDHTLLR
jgi:hypothetical protein